MTSQLCTKCQINEKLVSSHSYCAACKLQANQIYRYTHREELARKQRDYFQKNKTIIKIRRATYEKNWNWKRYGIIKKDGTPFTTVDFDRAYQIQQGRCQGCSIHQSDLRQVLHPDHDHATGFFRGLLCEHCNRALGLLKDNPDTLKKLTSYLEGDK